MLLFETLESDLRAADGLPSQRLPFYIEPAAGEALLSWLLRLATRLDVSLHTLASSSFGIDDPHGHTCWWRRPPPGILKRISERTAVGVDRLRRMTFEVFQPAYRDDEAPTRFAGMQYDRMGPDRRRAYPLAVCGACLEGDVSPYVRTPWLIGWMAVCPHHETVLIERCKACRAWVSIAPFTTVTRFSPTVCTRCGESLLEAHYLPAHPSVVWIQTALLRGKSAGITELRGLGCLTWEEMVTLMDVLIGMLWTYLSLAEQEEILFQYAADQLTRSGDAIYDCRHGRLRFLAWLLQSWPNSFGTRVAQSMLTRWLANDGPRLCRELRPPSTDPSQFEPMVRERLRGLAGGD